MKAVLTQEFVAAEPEVTRIITGNADSNQHMIVINAELGYQVLDEQRCWELEVAAVTHPAA